MTNNQILVGAQRQAQLEAAKAAFFMSGGIVTELESYSYKPLPARHEPQPKVKLQLKPTVYRRSKAEEAERARRREERKQRELRLVERITALRDSGLTRNETAAQIGVSYNGLRKIIDRNSIDYPKCYQKRAEASHE
ncbi:hypothetical protein D3C77_230840 [compost metagenome]